ncbi:hypothetical protein BJ508DRAFT_219177, partial [Ascobolus immersus RN42]
EGGEGGDELTTPARKGGVGSQKTGGGEGYVGERGDDNAREEKGGDEVTSPARKGKVEGQKTGGGEG